VKVINVRAFYPHYRHVAPSWRTHFWQIVVCLETDIGTVGWGYGGGGKAAVEVVNGHLRELLLGRNVDSVEGIGRLWDELYFACLPYGRRGIAVMALSGIDLALWDALGKAEGKSVCELLGGQRRQKVRAYASGSDLAWFRDLGFTAHKTSHHPAAGHSRVGRRTRSADSTAPRRRNLGIAHDCSWIGRGPRRVGAGQ
jgi:L-rhamnonate dehydratase